MQTKPLKPLKILAQSLTLSLIMALFMACDGPEKKLNGPVLHWADYVHYIDSFNTHDNELYIQHIPNAKAADFLGENIPYIDIPDQILEETYYFRWWTYRKHIKETEDGFVITEFLPKVFWSGKHNTINCPAGHHFYEGRWLRDPKYLRDYGLFWFEAGGDVRKYSFWAADAIEKLLRNHPDSSYMKRIVPHLRSNLQAWKSERRDSLETLYYQFDVWDGMEVTVSGELMNGQVIFSYPALRPTINSYIYGDLKALSVMEGQLGQTDHAATLLDEAEKLRHEVITRLWSEKLNHFISLPRHDSIPVPEVRELIGYVPWYFHLPPADETHHVAWKQVMDSTGFYAPWGLTTAEQRHPRFQLNYNQHVCEWNGPVWPFASTQTLKAMANLLKDYNQQTVSKSDYYHLLQVYANSHRRTLEDGRVVPWIDENQHPYSGDWIARTRLYTDENGQPREPSIRERGKDYNHSGFCDLIINDLLGVHPESDNSITIQPLIPEGTWDWFALDHIKVKDHELTVIWDRTGERYGKGKGFMVWVDGNLAHHSEEVKKVGINL